MQDQANVLSAETEKHVYDLNKSWESREDKPQLLVVTVSTLDGVPIERKAKELFDRYKPGMKGKNTGLVYLLSLTLPWLKPRDSCELGLLGFRRYA